MPTLTLEQLRARRLGKRKLARRDARQAPMSGKIKELIIPDINHGAWSYIDQPESPEREFDFI